MPTQKAFPTLIYSDVISSKSAEKKELQRQLRAEISDIKNLDGAGKEWSKKNYKNGFTSYASANELHRFSPTFARLEKLIDRHVAKFCRELDLDLGGNALRMTTCWVNIMPTNTHHGLHIHPLSVISGTYYLSVPKGASAIKFEDPRLPRLMASPPKKKNPKPQNQLFLAIEPKESSVVLFESWLGHEVPLNTSKQPRISISFNYGWE